ncbi:MAG TPA: hypothetical protein VK968_00900 [Roseimicrobium sp.]|nr:hypothetical protein [Roseimicrobium sp.]
MPKPATTFRIEVPTQLALRKLSDVLHRPMNQLVNEAVKAYVAQASLQVERELEDTLASLRALRASDPEFSTDIAKFAQSDAAHPDPLEGKVVSRPTVRVAGIKFKPNRKKRVQSSRTKTADSPKKLSVHA